MYLMYSSLGRVLMPRVFENHGCYGMASSLLTGSLIHLVTSLVESLLILCKEEPHTPSTSFYSEELRVRPSIVITKPTIHPNHAHE